jgi:hypothetical protein
MALGGSVSLHYDDELHFKVHCNRALAQRRFSRLGTSNREVLVIWAQGVGTGLVSSKLDEIMMELFLHIYACTTNKI